MRLQALPFLGLTILFWYEFLAVGFPWLGLPSLSFSTYGQLAGLSTHPLVGVATGVLGGVCLTLLILHLTGVLTWWRP